MNYVNGSPYCRLGPLSIASLLYFFIIILSKNTFLTFKMFITKIPSVILFGILGCYIFLHICENILKIGKISAKLHESGKIKAIFGLGMTPI